MYLRLNIIPTLTGGENPKVKIAGILHVENGKIVSYDHMSGHFKPNIKSVKEADKAFSKLTCCLFKGGKKKNGFMQRKNKIPI